MNLAQLLAGGRCRHRTVVFHSRVPIRPGCAHGGAVQRYEHRRDAE